MMHSLLWGYFSFPAERNKKMNKQTPHLALEVLNAEVRRTRFYKAAFVASFTAVVAILLDRAAEKWSAL